MKRIAIVSPSGKFYGSEQVLFDFLLETKSRYNVYVPKGELYDKLKRLSCHRIYSFCAVKLLYINLFFKLLLNKYDGVYINEAGHVKYISFLADIFRSKHFFIHIRLLEDCSKNRIGKLHKNVAYISTSEFISHQVFQNTQIQCNTIYDIYKPISEMADMRDIKLINNVCRFGIIGRVTPTKGLSDIIRFCNYCEKNAEELFFEFHFFGDVEKNYEVERFIITAVDYRNIKCIFHNFVNDKKLIYESIDILLHFNKVEAFGRIVLEALDFGVPFIGFNCGGIGEIARMFGVSEYMVYDGDHWDCDLYNKIIFLINNQGASRITFLNAKFRMKDICSPLIYCHKLEALFNE